MSDKSEWGFSEYKEPHEITEEERKGMEWGLRNIDYRLERILLKLEKDNPELYEAREAIRERNWKELRKNLSGGWRMNWEIKE